MPTSILTAQQYLQLLQHPEQWKNHTRIVVNGTVDLPDSTTHLPTAPTTFKNSLFATNSKLQTFKHEVVGNAAFQGGDLHTIGDEAKFHGTLNISNTRVNRLNCEAKTLQMWQTDIYDFGPKAKFKEIQLDAVDIHQLSKLEQAPDKIVANGTTKASSHNESQKLVGAINDTPQQSATFEREAARAVVDFTRLRETPKEELLKDYPRYAKIWNHIRDTLTSQQVGQSLTATQTKFLSELRSFLQEIATAKLRSVTLAKDQKAGLAR